MPNYPVHFVDAERNPLAAAIGFDPAFVHATARDASGEIVAVIEHRGAGYGSAGDMPGNRFGEAVKLLFGTRGQREGATAYSDRPADAEKLRRMFLGTAADEAVTWERGVPDAELRSKHGLRLV